MAGSGWPDFRQTVNAKVAFPDAREKGLAWIRKDKLPLFGPSRVCFNGRKAKIGPRRAVLEKKKPHLSMGEMGSQQVMASSGGPMKKLIENNSGPEDLPLRFQRGTAQTAAVELTSLPF